MPYKGRTGLVHLLEVILIFAADAAAIFLLFYLSILVRIEVLPMFVGGMSQVPPPASSAWWIVGLWVFFLAYEGLYTSRLSFWDEVLTLWKAVFFASVGVLAVVSLGRLSDEVSRAAVLLMGLMGLGLMPIVRTTLKRLMRRIGLLRRRVLVLGAGDTGRLIARALMNEPNYGYKVIGFLDDDPSKVGEHIEGVKVHRGVDDAERYLQRAEVTDLIIAMPGAGKERIQELINRYQHKAHGLMIVPDLFGMAVLDTTLRHFFDEQAFALELKNNLASGFNYYSKRTFDYVVGLVLLVLLALPLAVISLIVRMTSAGPAIFAQERVGRNGKPFMCYKFRTMYEDAQERLDGLLASDVQMRSQWEHCRKLDCDPRLTAIGSFLRKTSLDELPQIFNVLRGHMSLVGPRPVTQEEIDIYYRENALLCFSVLPGITGLWQVSGRSNTSYDYRVALDIWYVRNWNIWLDIIIMIRTVNVVIKADGAR